MPTVRTPDTGKIKIRNSAETKAKILAAAESEFAEKGLAGARVDEIAAAAGCNKGMIYQYYGSKTGLYEEVLLTVYKRLSDLEDIIISKDMGYEERIAIIVQEYFRFLSENESFVNLIMRENLNKAKYLSMSGALNIKDPMINAVKNLVISGKEQGVFAQSVDEKQVVLSLITGTFSYFSNRYTLSKIIHTNLFDEEITKKRIELVTESIIHYLKKG